LVAEKFKKISAEQAHKSDFQFYVQNYGLLGLLVGLRLRDLGFSLSPQPFIKNNQAY